MKMRKILPLVLLAVGALVLLSGCDAMLDAIFQSNVIKVDVWVQGNPSHADFAYGGSYQYIQLMDSSLNVIATAQRSYDSWDGTYAHYYFSFSKLKDGTYHLSTYYYGQITLASPSTSFLYDQGGIYFGTSITMPNTSYGDSTGHTANIVMYVP